MTSIEDLITSLQGCMLDKSSEDISTALMLFIQKLGEASRNGVRRCKERSLEEAIQLLKTIPVTQLHSLEESIFFQLARLLVSIQMEMVNITAAFRKLDQMLQHLSNVDYQIVFKETRHCLQALTNAKEVLSLEDMQRACMFLEDGAIGREVFRETCPHLLNKVSEMFPVILQQEVLKNGPVCYAAVKLCLEIFQLLPSQVAPQVWEKDLGNPAVASILQSLMGIILGQCSNRDTRMLAGTAVAMLINTAPEGTEGEAAAWSLLQVAGAEPWQLVMGGLQVRCIPTGQDAVGSLALSRGLLTCCQPHILLGSGVDTAEACLLLGGVFPLVSALCEQTLDCHYYVCEVLTLWLKKVKEYLADIWKITGRLLSDTGSLLQCLFQLIWNNAESPVEGLSEYVYNAFHLLLELYKMDCEQFGDTRRRLYFTLLQRVTNLPWEAKAKYRPLCVLLPYLGTDVVLEQYVELPNHILQCLSANHLSPYGSELYKCMIQQQRRELCEGLADEAPPSELELANHWARRWRPILLSALISEVTLLQNNGSTQLLPCTLQVFPSAVEPLLACLDPTTPGHLHAWACIMSSHRATTGSSPVVPQGGSVPGTLQLALGAADDKVRLAALNLLCCSPKTNEAPTIEELSIIREFIPQNLNSESSPFRQHFQTAVKKFLVRVRDSCLAHVRGQKSKKTGPTTYTQEAERILNQGVGFVEWLSQLPYSYLAQGHSYQRKKTVLLLLAAVLETCTDTWSPDKKKGQPPVNMASLINWARQRGHWNFFCRAKQLSLIGCLEDSTNEIRELSAELLVRFFPPSFQDNIISVLFSRSQQLLCSPRVQEAQMGALIMKVLLQKCTEQSQDCPWHTNNIDVSSSSFPMATGLVTYLVNELKQHYLTARADMMLAARTKPIHSVLSALERCVIEVPGRVCDVIDHRLAVELLALLESTCLLLLGMLYGAQDTSVDEESKVHNKKKTGQALQVETSDVSPSLYDMGNAISSLIAQTGLEEGEECVLLSEEHSLVLTCCWVSLKEIGIFLGCLVERILAESKSSECLLTVEDIRRASKVFMDILLKCRHWGAVEGCCVGFTKFCASLLSSNNPDLQDIPAHILQQGLQVVQSPRSTSVTRRAAGLPMLILSVVSAEEASKARPLLAHSIRILLDTARTPLPQTWDQTLDLPQVCAVHTLQALVRGSGLGGAILQFAPAVAILSLTLLRSPCWAMRNAALQLYSSLCWRMLGQRPAGEGGSSAQHGMSPSAFFLHYPALQPFLLGELRGAAQDVQGPSGQARLHLHPSLYPILTLLAKLQPGVPDLTGDLSDFLTPLFQLAASPIYSVRVMTSKALVAMTPPSEYMKILSRLTADLPGPQEPCCHNRLHGQLLQIKAVLDRAMCTDSTHSDAMCEIGSKMDALLWLLTPAQHCPLVKMAYTGVVDSLKAICSQPFLGQLGDMLLCEIHEPQHRLQLGSLPFHQMATQLLCADQRWARQIWDRFGAANADLRLTLVCAVENEPGTPGSSLQCVILRALQSNLKEALLSQRVDYRRTYLAALVTVTRALRDTRDTTSQQPLECTTMEGPALRECLELLLVYLQNQRGGPEFLSQALCAASLLLSHSLEMSVFQRWCSVLEGHRHPEAPEVLRMACAEALCLAGAPLISQALRERIRFQAISTRLINTGLVLLQDESQQARMRAACFASMLRCDAAGHNSLYLMQVNRALPFLLDLLLEAHGPCAETLDALLWHLPEPDMRSVLLRAASETGSARLYERDESNIFAEPSVMSACLRPYLVRLADKCCESASLAERSHVWARDNVTQVLDDLAACKRLQPGETLNSTWLALLMDDRFHGALCGLLTRAAFLLQLCKISEDVRALCDPAPLRENVQEVLTLFTQNGVHFPSGFTTAMAADSPIS